MIQQDNSIYSPDEQADLLKYKQIRNKIIDDMVQHGIHDNRDRRVINELISAAESSLHTSVANKLKHQDNLNKDAIAETISMLLKSTAAIKAEAAKEVVYVDTNLDDSVIPIDIVPGELEISPEPLDPKDFESINNIE